MDKQFGSNIPNHQEQVTEQAFSTYLRAKMAAIDNMIIKPSTMYWGRDNLLQ